MHELPQLDPETAAALNLLQSLDDAIAFRAARLARPCPGCAPAARCPDHAADEHLIAAYQHHHAEALRKFLDRYDPGVVRHVMDDPDGTPLTVLAGAVAMDARLRELAAAGPIITDLGDGPAVIELRAGQILEHPLHPEGGGSCADGLR